MTGSETGKDDTPRVARVEATVDSPTRSPEQGEGAPRVKDSWISEPRPESPKEPWTAPGVDESGGRLMEPGGTAEQDDRELIPVELDRLGRMENLLLQVIEENKSLKRRLETESRSHSSWYSGGLAAEQPFSPATFGQRAEDVHRFMSADFPGSAATGGANLGFSGMEVGYEGVFRGVPHSWPGPRFEVQDESMVPGRSPKGFGVGGPQGTQGSIRAIPPPPLPLPPLPGVEAQVGIGPPQTMTQLTESMLGVSAGFHTPRASQKGNGSLDPQGYPVSPNSDSAAAGSSGHLGSASVHDDRRAGP